MQYTTHFNLNLPEGTDVVNPLVQDNPNYTAIDTAMFANKQAVIGTASEVASGTAHAITRANTDSNYFRFTATSNWTAGDTMTVDGLTVSVYLSDGQTPASGAYVINSEVFCMISGTRVTLLTSGNQTAAQTTYSNAVSGLTATNVQDAIDETDSKVVSIANMIDTGNPDLSYLHGDADSITSAGIYRLDNDASHIPTTVTCIIYQIGSGYVRMQICRPYYPWDDSNGLWYRSTSVDSGAFGTWQRISLS